MTLCAGPHCERELPLMPRRGRSKKFCSRTCKQARYRFDAELKPARVHVRMTSALTTEERMRRLRAEALPTRWCSCASPIGKPEGPLLVCLVCSRRIVASEGQKAG